MVFDKDKIARLALYPKFIANGVFDVETLLSFHKMEGARWYAMSVLNRAILPSTDSVHAYGCRAATYANDGARKRSGKELASDELTHYIGFYDLAWGSVRRVPSNCFVIALRWKPENGENDHFQLELLPLPFDNSSKGARRKDMVAIRGVLGMLVEGPSRHVCDCDENIRSNLMAIELPPLSPVATPAASA